MVQINFATREVNCKVVYYGPGRCGKTTNLQVVHAKAPVNSTGELVSIATETDRTLYFDFLPLDLGSVAGMRTKFSLYTVPGQVYYDATRKLVLQGADGIVFVADSNPDMMNENVESLENLLRNLKDNGLEIGDVPVVIQLNKRDLPNPLPVDEMKAKLNKTGNWPCVEAVAVNGDGVFQTLKMISQQVIKKLNKEQGFKEDGSGRDRPGGMRSAMAPPPAPPPAAAPAAPSAPAPVAPPAPPPAAPRPPSHVVSAPPPPPPSHRPASNVMSTPVAPAPAPARPASVPAMSAPAASTSFSAPKPTSGAAPISAPAPAPSGKAMNPVSAQIAAQKLNEPKKSAPDFEILRPPEEEEEPKSKVGLILFLLVLIGGGAAYYFMVIKPKEDADKQKPVPVQTPPVAPATPPTDGPAAPAPNGAAAPVVPPAAPAAPDPAKKQP